MKNGGGEGVKDKEEKEEEGKGGRKGEGREVGEIGKWERLDIQGMAHGKESGEWEGEKIGRG
jgi:hypothetical protein